MFKLSTTVVRPILCGSWMVISGGLMGYGLVALGTAEVVPLWWQVIGGGLLGWWYKDRSALRSAEAQAKKAGGQGNGNV